MSIGQRVKKLRLQHHMTQQQLADFLGIGRSNLGHIENDRVTLEIEYARKLAEKFNTTTEYLLNGDESEMDPDVVLLHRAAKSMTPEQRRKAIQLLEVAFDDLFDDNGDEED